MKSKLWIVTLSSAALLAGCVVPTSEYCVVAKPILFGSQGTVDWLATNDERMLTDVTTHNEQVEALCN